MDILLGEPDEAVRDILVQRLDAQGHTVCALADSEHALARLAHFNPHLFIATPPISEMSLEALIRGVRDYSDSLPILVITGREILRERRRLLMRLMGKGKGSILKKPFLNKQFIRAIERLVSPTLL